MQPVTSGRSFLEAIDFWGRLVRATNFALDHWWVWFVLGLALMLLYRIRSQHRLIAQLDERADAAFADIDALLAERNTLIGNLVAVVRAFAAHEHQVIRDVLDARADALEAVGNAAINVERQIANSLQNLFAVSETYPQLAAEDHYRTLRNDLIRIEDKITAARKFYNLAVEEMNVVRRAFPGNFISKRNPMPTREKFTLGDRRAEFIEPLKINL